MKSKGNNGGTGSSQHTKSCWFRSFWTICTLYTIREDWTHMNLLGYINVAKYYVQSVVPPLPVVIACSITVETQELNTGWFKKIISISYVYISWTIHDMWMIYITFQRGVPKFSNTTTRVLAYRRAAASVVSKMATTQHKIFWFREFIKTESTTAVQRTFLLRFNI